MTKFGKTIIPKGTFPEKHELETAWFLNDIGKDIEFLVPVDKNHIKTPDIKMDGILCTLSFLNNSISIKTPDIKMDGILWEIKVPKNKGKHTIQHAFRKALYQSKYVIFDLQRIKMSNDKAISELKQKFKIVKICKRLLIITKDKKLLDLKR